mgnify:CR=1 FL=1
MTNNEPTSPKLPDIDSQKWALFNLSENGGTREQIIKEIYTGKYTQTELQEAAVIAAKNGNIPALQSFDESGVRLDVAPSTAENKELNSLSPLSQLAFRDDWASEEAATLFSDMYNIQTTKDEALTASLQALGSPMTKDTSDMHNKMDTLLKDKIQSFVEKWDAKPLGLENDLMQRALKGIATNGHSDTLQLLAEHGIVDLDLRDGNGQSLRDIINKGKEPAPSSNPQPDGFDQANFDARLQQLQDESGRTWTHRGGIANYVFTEAPDAKTAAQLSHDLNNAGVHSVFSGDDIEKGKTIVAIPADEFATLDASRTTNAATATKNLLGTVDDSFTAEPPVSNHLDTGWQESVKPQGLTR